MPTANKIDCAKLKTELEEYLRKPQFIGQFRNDEPSFATDRLDLSLPLIQGIRTAS